MVYAYSQLLSQYQYTWGYILYHGIHYITNHIQMCVLLSTFVFVTIILFPISSPCGNWMRSMKHQKWPGGKFHERMEKHGKKWRRGCEGTGLRTQRMERETEGPSGETSCDICSLLFGLLSDLCSCFCFVFLLEPKSPERNFPKVTWGEVKVQAFE